MQQCKDHARVLPLLQRLVDKYALAPLLAMGESPMPDNHPYWLQPRALVVSFYDANGAWLCDDPRVVTNCELINDFFGESLRQYIDPMAKRIVTHGKVGHCFKRGPIVEMYGAQNDFLAAIHRDPTESKHAFVARQSRPGAHHAKYLDFSQLDPAAIQGHMNAPIPAFCAIQ
jgi:hypothetical protein